MDDPKIVKPFPSSVSAVLFVFIVLSAIPALAAPPAGRNWSLEWAEEFNDSIDYRFWNNWHDKTWRTSSGDSIYLSAAQCLSVANGYAIIKTKKSHDTTYSSGLQTKLTYGPGYYEARCKSGRAWAGFWVQGGAVADCSPITAGCEFDIMENVYGHGIISQTIHWSGYGSCHQQVSSATNFSPDSFYIWGLQWSLATGATFYVNGTVTMTDTAARPTNAAPVIISVEYGDTGTEFETDYVRYYKDNGPSAIAAPIAGAKIKSFSCSETANAIKYNLLKPCFVSLKYYDLQGRTVCSFVNSY
ncbi:MAG: family 16 glycosylhydrolase [Chitinivibrionales bacterium]|nr:family 16 glycosylhydrolase [Chitinivibrionales bacterium]